MISVIIGIPVIIHCLFKTEASNEFLVATWSSGDFLMYYATILSFISTGVLSGLALWQNETIRKQSDKNNEILKQMEMHRVQPFFNAKVIEKKIGYTDVHLEIQNISDNIAIKPYIKTAYIETAEAKNAVKYQCSLPAYLKQDGTFVISFENERLDNDRMLAIEFGCKDIYDNEGRFLVCLKVNLQGEDVMLLKKTSGA